MSIRHGKCVFPVQLPVGLRDEDRRARQRGEHGEPGVAVRPDNGVHGLPEHIKRDAQRDIKEIFAGMAESLGVDGAAENADDGRGKRQIQRRQHHAAAHRHHHRVAHAALGGARLLPAKADAHIGAAAVTDHHRDGQRHHRERKHHRVGRVAVGAKVAGIRNENLVHDVVQSAHQQRHDAGHRILFHQLADALGTQKLI